jgi:hypothetical protein
MILDSSMKSTSIWPNVASALESRFNVSVLSRSVGSESISREDLYDKGLVDLPQSTDIDADEILNAYDGIFSRVDLYGTMPFDLKQLYAHRYITYWMQFIEANSVELVISPVAPHRIFDFSLLIACRKLGVNYIAFQTTPFEKRLFIIDRFVGPGKFIFELDIPNGKLPEMVEKDIILRSGLYDTAIPNYEKRNISLSKNNNYLKKIVSLGRKSIDSNYRFWSSFKRTQNLIKGGHISSLDYVTYLVEKHKRLRRLKSVYNRLSILVDDSREYIYFPLHYQPEETTCPSGGVFSNQLLVLDRLLRSTPETVLIYVKEHRSQFMKSANGDLARTTDFYECLIENPRVRLVDMSIDQFGLVDNAQMVATVTGTVGYEAYCRGVKTVLFGRTWLEGLTNVHSYKDLCGLRAFYFGDALQLDLNDKVKEICNIMKYSFSAIHDENYESIYGVPGIKDEQSLVEAISNYIEANYGL